MNEQRQEAWILLDSGNHPVSISLESEQEAWQAAGVSLHHPSGLLRQVGWRCVPVWVSAREVQAVSGQRVGDKVV